jgi:hypothetical protein
MGILRDRLHEANPALWQALERSWAIAHEEWLPALSVQKDSFNSYPHLRNLENYLDQVVLGFEAYPGTRTHLNLRPVEIYLLLSGILLHDIGRIINPKTHGQESSRLIREQSAQLGVQSEELAQSLSCICYFHDPGPHVKYSDLADEMKDIVIDPYGEVRQLLLGALLLLVDHLDSASTRVLPRYLRSRRQTKVIGAFRSLIRGVAVEPEARMIRTVLGPYLPSGQIDDGAVHLELTDSKASCLHDALTLWDIPTVPTTPVVKYQYHLKIKQYIIEPNAPVKPVYNMKIFNQVIADANLDPFSLHEELSLPQQGQGQDHYPLPKLFKCFSQSHAAGQDPEPLKPSDWLVARRWMQADLQEELGLDWPPNTLLAIILHNMDENCEALEIIRGYLASAGVPLLAWLLDYQGHLYNQHGEETFEPIFSKAYLTNVVRGMWHISTRVVGVSDFTYQTLAAHLREPAISRVRMAVRRIAIIAEAEREPIGTSDNPATLPEGERSTLGCPPIWYGDNTWRWSVKACPGFPTQLSPPHAAQAGCTACRADERRCAFVDVNRLTAIINDLTEPRA